MSYSPEIQQALTLTWHPDVAGNSLQRWLELSQQEDWNMSVEMLDLLISLFGASWYFTRFCFFRGSKILRLFDKKSQDVSIVESALDELEHFTPECSLDKEIEQLRIRKNEIMLSTLLLQLDSVINQARAEVLLTRLAEAVLVVMYRIFGLGRLENIECIILGMGRFAGYEMNYGSDLDLIFIEKIFNTADSDYSGNKIRKMLRTISTMDPSGSLYEIDMRLRPHGNSGILVTPLDSFLKYHQSEREIWERQMMTRSRIVAGDNRL